MFIIMRAEVCDKLNYELFEVVKLSWNLVAVKSILEPFLSRIAEVGDGEEDLSILIREVVLVNLEV